MQEMFFEISPDMTFLTSEMELQALDGFTDWYKQEYGVALVEMQTTQSIQKQTVTSQYIEKSLPQSNHKEVIQKIASILVDMVIEENGIKQAQIH